MERPVPLNVTQEQWQIIHKILYTLPEDTTIYFFGSRVTGNAKPFSDVDIALECPEPLHIRELAELEEAFTESDLPFKVDIVQVQDLSEEFMNAIRSHWICLNLANPQ